MNAHGLTNADDIAEELCAFARRRLISESISIAPDTPLARIGIDSASLVELLLFIERRFGLGVPDGELTREHLVSLDALARCVAQLAMRGAETDG